MPLLPQALPLGHEMAAELSLSLRWESQGEFKEVGREQRGWGWGQCDTPPTTCLTDSAPHPTPSHSPPEGRAAPGLRW